MGSCAVAIVALAVIAGCGGSDDTTTVVSTTTGETTTTGLTEVGSRTADEVNDCLEDHGWRTEGTKQLAPQVEATESYAPDGMLVSIAPGLNPARAEEGAHYFGKRGEYNVQISADGQAIILSEGELIGDAAAAVGDCTTGG